MNKFFNEINKNFGFGCMRLPMLNEKDVDFDQVSIMVDDFIKQGFNYFDTAHVYIGGQSEEAIKRCLATRYKRDQFVLTNKLSPNCFNSEEDIVPFLNMQLEACGVEYFDFYLMHALNKTSYENKYKRFNAFKVAEQLKKEGKIKHIGMSFHDSAEVLDLILTEQPCIECVQIQLNYLDYEDASIQSRQCYEVCVKHHKPVIIMEPVKGGSLIRLPNEAFEVLKGLNVSAPNLAIRFAASHNQVMMVLSGMSNIEQMNDNLSFMKDFKPLNNNEFEGASKIAAIIRAKHMIACTGCRYCVDGCPKNIMIPDLFACYNANKYYGDKNANGYYRQHTTNHGKPSECLKCGKCENSCPQHLHIRDLLVEVDKEFSK